MPPPDHTLWAVGYARGYSTLDAGMEAAKADAYERLRRTRRVTIKGERLYEDPPGFQMRFVGSNFTETGLPDTLRSVTYVDSLQAGGMTLVLAGWTSDGGGPRTVPSTGREAFAETPPAWVQGKGDTGPSEAVGRASRFYHLENSWHRAEKQARRQLALQAATKIRRLNKDAGDWQHDVLSLQTEVRLRRVQTVARWADADACYVLVEGVVDEVLIE